MILNWQSDAYLSKAGFFSALSPKHQILAGPKKLRLADNLTVKLVLSDYGPPTAQDFTYYLAYLKLLTYRAAGSDDLATLLQRPQPVTNYQLLRLLGQTQGHNNYQSLEDWRLRLRFTGLALHQTDSKARQELTPLMDSYAVSALSRQAPDAAGEAEKHTLLFAPWLQEALARAPLLLVAEGAWARYRTLTSPLAQLLVPQLDRWLYATRQEHTFVKNYQNLAHLLGLPVHPSRIRIQRQLHFGLGQLVAAGYLQDWKLERARHYETVYNVVLQGPAQGASVAVPHMPPAADTEASFRASETRQDAPHPAPAANPVRRGKQAPDAR